MHLFGDVQHCFPVYTFGGPPKEWGWGWGGGVILTPKTPTPWLCPCKSVLPAATPLGSAPGYQLNEQYTIYTTYIHIRNRMQIYSKGYVTEDLVFEINCMCYRFHQCYSRFVSATLSSGILPRLSGLFSYLVHVHLHTS